MAMQVSHKRGVVVPRGHERRVSLRLIIDFELKTESEADISWLYEILKIHAR